VTTFVADVQSAFLPSVKDLGFTVVSEQTSDAFGDALVVLRSGDLQLRVVRDRSQIFADLGSVAEPAIWFDSSLVMRALGLTNRPAFGGTDPRIVLAGIAAFLNSMWPELIAMFDTRRFAATKRELDRIREEQAAERAR